jgi:hypothetical protein
MASSEFGVLSTKDKGLEASFSLPMISGFESDKLVFLPLSIGDEAL